MVLEILMIVFLGIIALAQIANVVIRICEQKAMKSEEMIPGKIIAGGDVTIIKAKTLDDIKP